MVCREYEKDQISISENKSYYSGKKRTAYLQSKNEKQQDKQSSCREAGQTAANAFCTFADKSEVDYSQKEQKHPITKAVLAPMKAVKKMPVSMELHLDASIDKLDNLTMNVQLDKEKHMENTKNQKQTEPERAEAE